MNLVVFLFGIHFAVFGAASVFFWKFWRASRDRFYLLFSLACLLLAVERVAILVVQGVYWEKYTPVSESNSWVYFLRLFAFLFILMAIVNKNRRQERI